MPARQWTRIARIGLGLALALTGCATRPSGLMTPVGQTVQGAATVDLLVATNRQPSDNPAILFTGDRALTPSVSEVVVSIPPEAVRKVGHIQWQRKTTANPATDFAVVSVRPSGDDDIHAWFARASADNGGHLLIFVHGFNTPYDSGVFLLAQVVHDSGMKVAPVLFSWPSRGQILAYDYDRESATYSRTLLADIIDKAALDPKVIDITILGHSMGCWLSMEALRTLALREGHVPDKVHNVILASPDIDVTVFRSQYTDLGPQHPKVTVMVSRGDRALSASRMIGGQIDRLGAIDVDNPVYKTAIQTGDVTVIDVSKVKADADAGHLKFSESPDVVKILGESLINGQELSEDQATLAEKLGILITGGNRDLVDGTDKVRRKLKGR